MREGEEELYIAMTEIISHACVVASEIRGTPPEETTNDTALLAGMLALMSGAFLVEKSAVSDDSDFKQELTGMIRNLLPCIVASNLPGMFAKAKSENRHVSREDIAQHFIECVASSSHWILTNVDTVDKNYSAFIDRISQRPSS